MSKACAEDASSRLKSTSSLTESRIEVDCDHDQRHFHHNCYCSRCCHCQHQCQYKPHRQRQRQRQRKQPPSSLTDITDLDELVREPPPLESTSTSIATSILFSSSDSYSHPLSYSYSRASPHKPKQPIHINISTIQSQYGIQPAPITTTGEYQYRCQCQQHMYFSSQKYQRIQLWLESSVTSVGVIDDADEKEHKHQIEGYRIDESVGSSVHERDGLISNSEDGCVEIDGLECGLVYIGAWVDGLVSE